MNREWKSIALALCLGLTAGSAAQAQSKWTGVSLGLGVGAGAINHDLTIGPGPALPPGSFAFNFDGIGGEGFFGTVGVAADMQVHPSIVMGVFFDYDFADMETNLGLSIPAFGGLNVTGKVKLENQWTIGARAGFLATPDTLWYGLVGYTQAEVSDFTFAATGPLTGSLAIGVPKMNGFVFGGGVETNIAPNWSLKAEYRFTQLDAERLDLPFGLNTFVNAELEPSIHTGRVSINYKFDWNRLHRPEPMK